MAYPRYWPLLAVLAMGSLAPSLATADSEMEARLARLERIVESRSGSDLLLEVQRLQQEISELRGLIESQQFEIQELSRQQREQYLDLDGRVRSLSPASGGAGVAAPAAPGPGAEAAPAPGADAAADERDAYAAAFAQLKEGHYPEADAAFSAFLKKYPQGRHTDAALYWLGESRYLQRDHAAALESFRQLVRTRSGSDRVPAALLRIGDIELEQGAPDQARASFEQLLSLYPNSAEAALARERLERL